MTEAELAAIEARMRPVEELLHLSRRGRPRPERYRDEPQDCPFANDNARHKVGRRRAVPGHTPGSTRM